MGHAHLPWFLATSTYTDPWATPTYPDPQATPTYPDPQATLTYVYPGPAGGSPLTLIPRATPTYPEHWIIEAHIEGQAKCDDQQKRQSDQPAKSVEDVQKHDDINAGQRQLLDENDELNPAEEYDNGANLPLPGVGAEADRVEHPDKGDGETKEGEFEPVDPAQPVDRAQLCHLEHLD